MEKVLLVASVGGFISQFEMNAVKILQDMKFEIHYASNFDNMVYQNDIDLNDYGIILHQVDFQRSLFAVKKQLEAFFQLRKVIKSDDYKLIHCHTPFGAALTRLACKKLKKKPPIIYTAHGFHFFKGAPLFYWLLYYPIEKYLSQCTDILITINREDYDLATQNFYAKQVKYFFEPEFDYNKYYQNKIDVLEKKKELRIDNEFVFVTVGELNKNKNQKVAIEALACLKEFNFQYLLIGEGKKRKELEKLVRRYGLQDKVQFLGYRKDVKDILKCANCYIQTSIREGVGMAAIEAMASGLFLITAKNRASKEYLYSGIRGLAFSAGDSCKLAEQMKRVYEMESFLKKEIIKNNSSVIKKYDKRATSEKLMEIYNNVIKK